METLYVTEITILNSVCAEFYPSENNIIHNVWLSEIDIAGVVISMFMHQMADVIEIAPYPEEEYEFTRDEYCV